MAFKMDKPYSLFQVVSLTYSNIRTSQELSMRSYGLCAEAPYVAALLEKHRQDEAECKRKIAEIEAKYALLKS